MNSNIKPISEYSLIVFDLDGTLAPSKCPIDKDISELLLKLIDKTKVAVISGAGYHRFEVQLLHQLPLSSKSFTNLLLLPTSGTRLYVWRASWNEQYTEQLTPIEKSKITNALNETLINTGFAISNNSSGDLIEDRGTQITFSGLGQNAPLDAKSSWDPERVKRQKIADILKPKIPEFDIRFGGTTSIDITKRGINKAYGIRKLEEYLKINPEKILFIGDALYQGGNDFPAKATGVDCIQVSGPEETKKVLIKMLE